MTASPATAATPTSREMRAREPYIDNLKGVLIALVVIGHTVGQFVDTAPGGQTVYAWIYLFHMPAFVLLCGVLTTSPDLDGRRVGSMVRTLLVPYVIFQIAYTAFFRAGGQSVPWGVDSLLTPLYQLWFLVALFAWRLLAPFFARFRGSVVLAVLVSLAAGMSQIMGPGLTLNRVAALIPFFVIGLIVGRRALSLPSNSLARCVAAVVLVMSFPAAAAFNDRFGRGWLFWRATYRALSTTAYEGMTIRILMIGWALVVSAAVFTLVPRGKTTVLTAAGEHSMYPYLLHGFFVQAFGWSAVEVTTVWGFVVSVLAAVGLVAALSSRPVRAVFGTVVEPRRVWILR